MHDQRTTVIELAAILGEAIARAHLKGKGHLRQIPAAKPRQESGETADSSATDPSKNDERPKSGEGYQGRIGGLAEVSHK